MISDRKIADFEATHTRQEVVDLAREMGFHAAGTKRELVVKILTNPVISIPLTDKQIDVVIFRFIDVGHTWIRFMPPFDRARSPYPKNLKLLIPRSMLPEALSIMESAVNITKDEKGRAEHQATVALYEKLRAVQGETGRSLSLPETLPMVKKTGREGLCYEMALRNVIAHNEGTLVHGIVWSYVKGQMIAHAWVVHQSGPLSLVWEPVSNEWFPKDWLYEKFRMKEEQTYTPEEAAVMVLRTKHYGPWGETKGAGK